MVNPATFDAGRLALLEQIAVGAPLPGVLDGTVRLIEQQADGMLGSILLVDAERQRVTIGAAPSLPPAFAALLDGMQTHAGACGAAALHGQRVIVDDIASHPQWTDYRELALSHGLQACWFSPIFSPARKVLGTFAMFYRERRPPTAAEIELVDAATHLAAVAIVRDRIEQSLRASEGRACQLARLYAVSSGINEAIVRVRDPDRLYELACRIAVEQGFARLAWVGLRDEREDLLVPVASHGDDDGYISAIRLRLSDPLTNRGPAGRAMNTGVYATSNDIATDPGFYFKSEARARGFRSCAVFPLTAAGQTLGAFALYLDRADGFGDEELRVLSSLAADLSFAVESARGEQERQRLSRDLGDAERLRALIFDSVADTIFYLAVEPDDRFRFLSVNRAFLTATGLVEPDIVGRFVDEVIPEPSLSLVLTKYRDAIRTGHAVRWDEVSTYPAGIQQGEVTITPICDDTGRCTNLLGTVHDITARVRAVEERRQLELQLHQAQRMQSLGTLAGGIAHDFNNVLAAIRGHAELAAAELRDSPGSPAIVESLSEIVKGSRRASSLVSQILTFSRRAEPKREALDLGTVVREAATLLRSTLPAAVVVRTEVAPATPTIHADSTQVHQIVVNMVTNAAQALGPRGGIVDLSVRGVLIDDDTPCAALAGGRYVKLTIADRGSGMDRATLARDLRAVLHHQGAGPGHRARAGGRARHHDEPPGRRHRGERAWPRDDVRSLFSGGCRCGAGPAGGNRGRAAGQRYAHPLRR